MQAFRPHASRIFNRLDILVRSAVERTTLPANINSIQSKIDKLTNDVAALQESLSAVCQQNALPTSLASTKFDQIQVSEQAYQQHLNQLLTRLVIPLSDGFVAARDRNGYLVFDRSDPALSGYLAEGVLPEPGTIAFVEQLLQPGDRFLDVGAGVGLYTVIAARKVGRTGSVLAIEPTPATLRALRFCSEINQVADIVDIREVAAGRRSEERELFEGGTSGQNSLFQTGEAKRSIKVGVKSLDELVAPATTFALAKIDVEGSEIDVINGMRRILKDNPNMPVVAEFNPAEIFSSGRTPESWLESVRSLGFQIYEIDDATLKVQHLRSDAGLQQVHSLNLLFVRDSVGAVAKLLPSIGAS